MTSIWSANGLDYDTVPVNPGVDTYGSSTTAPRDFPGDNFFFNDADPCIGGPNLDNDRFEVFCSPDDGEFWFFSGSVDDVLPALLGGTVSNFGPTGFNSFWVFAASTTNVPYNLTITDTVTGVSKTFDNDVSGNTLADSCGVSTPFGNGVIYRNRSEQNIKIVTFANDFGQFGGYDPVVHVVGEDPDFNAPGEQGFYGFGCTPTPGNPNGTDIGFIGPGGKRWDIDLDTGTIIESIQPLPNKNTQSGPNAMTRICNDLGDSNDNSLFDEGFESGDTSAWSQSLDSQFIYVLNAKGIPSLNQWGLISLGLILLVIGAVYLRRRKSRA